MTDLHERDAANLMHPTRIGQPITYNRRSLNAMSLKSGIHARVWDLPSVLGESQKVTNLWEGWRTDGRLGIWALETAVAEPSSPQQGFLPILFSINR